MGRISLNAEIKRYYERLRDANADAAAQRDVMLEQRFPDLNTLKRRMVAAGLKLAERNLSADLSVAEQHGDTAEDFSVAAEAYRDYLQFNGLEDVYGQLPESCALCHDYGYVDNKSCPQCYSKALARVLEHMGVRDPLGAADFADFNPLIFADVADADQDRALYKDRSPRENILLIKEKMLQYVSALQERRLGARPNLLFIGGPGTGKTFMACCVAKAARDKGLAVVSLSSPQLFANMSALRTLEQSYSPAMDKLAEYTDFVQQIYECDLLLVDDLGTERTDAVTASQLLELLNRRSLDGKATIISGNLSIPQLKARYDERITSRLLGAFKPYFFNGSDVRIQMAKES